MRGGFRGGSMMWRGGMGGGWRGGYRGGWRGAAWKAAGTAGGGGTAQHGRRWAGPWHGGKWNNHWYNEAGDVAAGDGGSVGLWRILRRLLWRACGYGCRWTYLAGAAFLSVVYSGYY